MLSKLKKGTRNRAEISLANVVFPEPAFAVTDTSSSNFIVAIRCSSVKSDRNCSSVMSINKLMSPNKVAKN